MTPDGETVEVDGVEVRGLAVDADTRCAHYAGERDVVAIEFACCGYFFPCAECHDALAEHAPAVWPREKHARRAILCGACGERLSIEEYLDALAGGREEPDTVECPHCGALFNPGCLDHVDRYFER